MKYLHIFPVEKFTTSYIDFINKNFPQQDHFFLLFGAPSSKDMMSHSNVWYCDSFKKRLFTLEKLLFRAQKIYFHSLFLPDNFFLLLFLQSWLLKKSHWVIWGGELYAFREKCTGSKSQIHQWVRKKVFSNIAEISGVIKGDYYLARQFCGVKGKYMDVIYPNPTKREFLDSIISIGKEKSVINIQLGNSATPTNRHMVAIDILARFRSENINIFCPLSYGDKEYANKVAKYGHDTFGDKFIAMFDFLPPHEYAEFLSNIDIAVFNHDRQQGLNNILALLYLGKKVFISDEITSWEELRVKYQFTIYSINSIKNSIFKDFICNDSLVIGQNKKSAAIFFSKENIKRLWGEVFNY